MKMLKTLKQFLGPDLLTATCQPTAVPLNLPSCLAAPVDHVRPQGGPTNGPPGHRIGGGDKWRLNSVAALRGGPSCQRVDRPVLGSPHHHGGRPDPLLSHQEKSCAVLCEGQPGTCDGTGRHGPPTPDNHGASPWLPPLGPDCDPVPGPSSDQQRHREHAGSDPAAVLYAGKSARHPEDRSEIPGGPRSPPPQPVPIGLSQIEMSEKIVL